MSNQLRQKVWEALSGDAAMIALGINTATLFPMNSPDTPPADQWATLRWGTVTPGVGAAQLYEFALWAYNRQPDYGPVNQVLARAKLVVAGLESAALSPGHILSTGWLGDSTDLFDDVFRAVTRNATFRLAASG